ncbi:hypothetical protein BU24DRAFT_216489 [Aaosphaeria arxii CBS 175.79]|uniref:Uncharacterized protein n=1 Tax=Aaosphaeria arxii CBS 175.79 TaxID=1450172 RepID=A0A6A5XNS2_9PLEO|nr:uncharacterized protein BU24DRAFT_216489 [Aaosphaeria arxii CBS 175.79]KAF2014556.1 hypothetical protein BU24DRAFT_216489 [Aaosphaeria arxii CBS 175.79]
MRRAGEEDNLNGEETEREIRGKERKNRTRRGGDGGREKKKKKGKSQESVSVSVYEGVKILGRRAMM